MGYAKPARHRIKAWNILGLAEVSMPPGRFSSPGTAFDWRKISDVTFNVDAGEKSAVGDVRGLMQALASCVLNLNMLQTQRLMKSRGLFFFALSFFAQITNLRCNQGASAHQILLFLFVLNAMFIRCFLCILGVITSVHGGVGLWTGPSRIGLPEQVADLSVSLWLAARCRSL